MAKKLILKRNLITFLLLVIFTAANFIQDTQADYNIKEGDTFRFHLETLKDTNGETHTFTQGILIFKENVNIKLEFTMVDLPYIRYSLTISGNTKVFAVLTNIIVQDRNWEELSTEYESYGYEIYEDDDVWGVRQNDTTIVVADFLKKDGVLNYFYAVNESQLMNYFDIGEIKIVRLADDQNYYWTLSFIAIIPISLLIYFIIRIRKRKLASTLK